MSNYGFIFTSIVRLKTQGVALSESIKIIKNTKDCIHFAKIEGSAQAKVIDDKINKVMEKNIGFDPLQKTLNILNGQNEYMDGLPADICSGDILFFKFAPITSVDEEYSFSKYRYILVDDRRSFKFSNLRKHLIAQ